MEETQNQEHYDQDIHDFFETFNSRHCPYLGSETDELTARAFPTGLNLCYRKNKPASIPLEMQGNLCLSDNFPTCAIFQERIKPPEKPEKVSGRKKWVQHLAVFTFFLLIVLAALVWWPKPGQSMQEASVFGLLADSEVVNAEYSAEFVKVRPDGAVVDSDEPGAVGPSLDQSGKEDSVVGQAAEEGPGFKVLDYGQ